MNIFELFENKNWSSNTCPPIGFSQFLSLGFEKSEKIKIYKFRGERKKIISEKNSSTKFLYPLLGESIVKKSAKLEMVSWWSLVAWSILLKNRS
jgi:hypothetical protein